MAMHYERVPGDDGGVRDVPGEPPGTRLLDLLGEALPPERVALEIGVGLCEILYIAEEDRRFQGDLDPSDVWISGDGIIALGGFDVPRSRTRAPEGSPRGATTDRYGLGMLLAWLSYPRAVHLRDVPKEQAVRHDEAVRRWLSGADGGLLPHDIDAVLRGQIEALLTFDRFVRLDAVMAWRALRGAAELVEGPDLVSWALDAHRGQPALRKVMVADDELAPAVALDGPMAQPMRFSTSATRTLFWSTDSVAEEEVARPKRAAAEATRQPEPATRPVERPVEAPRAEAPHAASHRPRPAEDAPARPVVPEDSVRLPLGDLRALAREAVGDALPVAPDPVRERSYRPEPLEGGSGNRPPTNPGTRSAPQPGSWDWKPADAPEPGRRRPAPVTAPRPAAPRPADPPPAAAPSLAERTARRDPVGSPPAGSPPARPAPVVSPPRPAPVEPPVAAPVATVGAYATVGEAAYEEPPEPPAERAIPTWVLIFLAVCAVLFLLAMAVLAAVVWYVYLSDSGAAASLSILRTSNGVV